MKARVIRTGLRMTPLLREKEPFTSSIQEAVRGLLIKKHEMDMTFTQPLTLADTRRGGRV